MLGQCVFVIGFGQSERFVARAALRSVTSADAVGRSDGVCFGLAGLVGFSGFGRCQCAVNTIVNSAFVITSSKVTLNCMESAGTDSMASFVSVSEVTSSAVASVVFSSS